MSRPLQWCRWSSRPHRMPLRFIARAFQKATQSIPPVVMTEDMVAAGFATSLAQPGGNITGISLMSSDLDGKRQDILMEAVPGAHRIAALADPNVATLEYLKIMEESARKHGKELLVVHAASASDLIPAINDASSRGAAALNVLSSPMLHLNRHVIITRTAQGAITGYLSVARNRRRGWSARLWSELYRNFPATRQNGRQSAARRKTQRFTG